MPGGQQISVSQGVLGAPGGVLLTGQQVAVSQGIVLWHPNETSSLIGQPIVTGQGTLVFRSQSGQQINTGQGVVGVANPQLALIGQQINAGQGVVTALGNNVTVNITGEEVTSLQGVVAVGPVLLTGVVGNSGTGSVAAARQVLLVGIPINVVQDVVIPGIEADDTFVFSSSGAMAGVQTVALTGSAITTQSGFVSTDSKEVTLVGQVVSSAVGTLSAVLVSNLVGGMTTAAQQSVGAPGVASVSGALISTSQGFVEAGGAARTAALLGAQAFSESGILRVIGVQQGGPTRRQHLRFKRDAEGVLLGAGARMTARPEFVVEVVPAQIPQPAAVPLLEPLIQPYIAPPVAQPAAQASPTPPPAFTPGVRRASFAGEAAKAYPLVGSGRRAAVPPPASTPVRRKSLRQLEAEVAALRRRRQQEKK